MEFQCFVNSTNINYWYLYGIILIGKLEAFLRKFTLIFKIFFLYNEIRDRSLIVWRHDWNCWYYQVLDIYSCYVWKKIKWMNPPRPSIKPASTIEHRASNKIVILWAYGRTDLQLEPKCKINSTRWLCHVSRGRNGDFRISLKFFKNPFFSGRVTFWLLLRYNVIKQSIGKKTPYTGPSVVKAI